MLRWVDRYNRTLPVEQKLKRKQWHGKIHMQVCDLRKVSTSSSDENSKRIFLYSDSPSSCGATLLEQIQLQVANVRKEEQKRKHKNCKIGIWTFHFTHITVRFDFSTHGQRSHSPLQWGSNIWWRFGEIHFFPIPVHELLFKLWWRCSLEVAGCSLEEEPTAHPVFPLCSGSFAWNQLYCCCENSKLSCNSLRFLLNFDQLLTQTTTLTTPRNLVAFRVFQWLGHNIGIEPAKTGSQWVGVANNKEARGRFQRTAPPPLFLPGKQWNWIRKGFAPSVCAGSTRSPAIQEPLQLRAHVAATA